MRKAGNRVRIMGQLIDAEAAGAHLWADRFDGSLEDIFELQDQVAASVVGAVEPTLRKVEIARARRKRPENLAAYDLYLQALPHAYAYRPDDNLRALELLRQALALDPGFAPASAHAAWCYEQRLTSGWATTVDGDAERAVTLARQAVGADNLDARSMALAGFVLVMVQGDYDAGMTIMQRGLELNPGDASLATLSGWAHCVAGNLDAAEAEFRRALRFSPADPMAYQMLTGEAFVHLREDYERAVTSIRHAATRSADWADLHLVLTIAYAHLGKDEEARAAVAKLRQLEPGVSQTEKVRVFRDEGHRRIIVEGLAKAGF